MNRTHLKLLWLALIGMNPSSALAAPFQNLGFEEYEPATGLVPGWTFENERVTTVNGSKILTHLPLDYGIGNPLPPLPPYATLYSSSTLPYPGPADPGQYILGLIPRVDDSGFYPWAVRQTAEIPADAKSMSFELGGAQVALKMNGTELPLEYFFRSDTTFAGWDFADISAFAGQTVTMELTAPGRLEYLSVFGAPGAPTPYTLLDNIRFSSDLVPAIPEPETLALSIVGVLVLFLRWPFGKD
jgi:hypothetical protein